MFSLQPEAASAPASEQIDEFWRRLQSALRKGSQNRPNESSLYGYISLVLTSFCFHAKLDTYVYPTLFPQKDLKVIKTEREFRAPDFAILLGQPKGGPITSGVLIWEAKSGTDKLRWSGKQMSDMESAAPGFPSHFQQVCEQVKHAREEFKQTTIYAILSIDVWFLLFRFPHDALLPEESEFLGKHLSTAASAKLSTCIAVPPSPIFNNNWTGFSPQFLYALYLSITGIEGMRATVKSFFQPPQGSKDIVNSDRETEWFREMMTPRGNEKEFISTTTASEPEADRTEDEYQESPARTLATSPNDPPRPRSPVMTRSRGPVQSVFSSPPRVRRPRH